MAQYSPGELTDVLQKNHGDFYNSDMWALGTQWIQTNHKNCSNLGTCALDAELCPQVTIDS